MTTSTPRRRPRWLFIPILVAVVVAGLLVARSAVSFFSPHLYAGTVFQQSTPAPAMDGLLLDSGQAVDFDDFDNKIVLVYFGYTNCPDVCPTTLRDVAKALDILGDDGDRVTLLMVSIDPERDGLEATGDYVRFFDERFYGVAGPLEASARVASQYGVFFQPTEVDEDGTYEMDHTASLMGIDTNGDLRIVWPPAIEAQVLADDLEALLK